MGNLVYRKTARNFGPVMATAADHRRSPRCARSSTIGELDPEAVVTPGIYVDRVVDGHERASSEPLTRTRWPRAVARDIPPGSFVNLGIGQPTMVADHLDRRLRGGAAHRERHAQHGPGRESATRSTPT